jgi:hypothetical protein
MPMQLRFLTHFWDDFGNKSHTVAVTAFDDLELSEMPVTFATDGETDRMACSKKLVFYSRFPWVSLINRKARNGQACCTFDDARDGRLGPDMVFPTRDGHIILPLGIYVRFREGWHVVEVDTCQPSRNRTYMARGITR